MNAIADAGSFRDPAGRVFVSEGRILRTVMPQSAAAYEGARDSGLLARLIGSGLMVGAEEVDPAALAQDAAAPSYLLEHPRIPFVTYPYEWSFPLHKAAALHHLDVHLEALEAGFTLSDASAYNIQFVGTRPVFIDHLSLRRYREGEIGPATASSACSSSIPCSSGRCSASSPILVPRQPGGHRARGARAAAQSWHKLSLTVAAHVSAQAALQRPRCAAARPPAVCAATACRAMRWSDAERPAPLHRRTPAQGDATVWGDYAGDNSYADAEAAAKRRFVSEMVAATRPGLLLDLGCNSGDYSCAALEAGAGRVIGFDFDHGALERAFARFDAARADLLPLWLDAANPSPSQGWGQAERQGLAERARADALIALAFIHHIAIGRNVPLDMALDWLLAMAPVGVIEFPPKSDPMVQRLLSQRDDIFPDYDEANFLALLGARARVVRAGHLSEGGRLLVWYDRS